MQRPQEYAAHGVHETVDLTDLAFDPFDDGTERRRIEQIAREGSRRTDVTRDALQAGVVASHEDDPVASREQTPRRLGPDAAGTAGDDDDLLHGRFGRRATRLRL